VDRLFFGSKKHDPRMTPINTKSPELSDGGEHARR